MLLEVVPKNLHLRSNDLKSYVGLARVAKALEHHDIVEYWKSAPYVLNFMDEYKLKREFEVHAVKTGSENKLIQTLSGFPDLTLSWDDIERYAELDPANARVRALMTDTIESRDVAAFVAAAVAALLRTRWTVRRARCDGSHEEARVFVVAGRSESCCVIALLRSRAADVRQRGGRGGTSKQPGSPREEATVASVRSK